MLRLPESSTYGPHLFHATVWVPRPFVGRFILAASASGTGKHSALEDKDKVPHARVAAGILSRPHVPVFHFTGTDNGLKQEYALIFRLYTTGAPLGSAPPAGPLGGGPTPPSRGPPAAASRGAGGGRGAKLLGSPVAARRDTAGLIPRRRGLARLGGGGRARRSFFWC